MQEMGEQAPIAILKKLERDGVDIQGMSQGFRQRLAMERSVHDHIAGDNEMFANADEESKVAPQNRVPHHVDPAVPIHTHGGLAVQRREG